MASQAPKVDQRFIKRPIHMKHVVMAALSMQIQSKYEFMRIDRVHMAQQLNRFNVNCQCSWK